MIKANTFTLEYYGSILGLAKQQGYQILTLEDFWDKGCPTTKTLVLRHDVDVKTDTLKRMLDVERKHGCCSTLYVRVAGAPYNVLSYPLYRVLSDARADGFAIGLHTNYFEFATLNNESPLVVLSKETKIIQTVFPGVRSLASHRDHDFVHNCLPHVEEHWVAIQGMGFDFQAYDKRIHDAAEYVNEGYLGRLTWRNKTPEEVIRIGRSLFIMTHSHWWHEIHPFE